MEQKDIIDFAKNAYEAFPRDSKKADLVIREFIRNTTKVDEAQTSSRVPDNSKTYFGYAIMLVIVCLILIVILFTWAVSKDIIKEIDSQYFIVYTILFGLSAIIIGTMGYIFWGTKVKEDTENK